MAIEVSPASKPDIGWMRDLSLSGHFFLVPSDLQSIEHCPSFIQGVRQSHASRSFLMGAGAHFGGIHSNVKHDLHGHGQALIMWEQAQSSPFA